MFSKAWNYALIYFFEEINSRYNYSEYYTFKFLHLLFQILLFYSSRFHLSDFDKPMEITCTILREC